MRGQLVAVSTTTAIRWDAMFCWCFRLASVVTKNAEPFLFGRVQQLAIRQLRPTELVSSDDFMLRQRAMQRLGRALIEQYAHLSCGKRAAGGVI